MGVFSSCLKPFKNEDLTNNDQNSIQNCKLQIPSIIVTETVDGQKPSSIIIPNKTHLFASNMNPASSCDSGFSSPVSEPGTPNSNSLEFTPLFQSTSQKCSKWIQICGHQDSFVTPDDNSEGIIMKKYSDIEKIAYFEIAKEQKLSSFVPKFFDVFEDSNGNKFLKIEDLLCGYKAPNIMDCKMGCRTYLIQELALVGGDYRNDLYEKMITIDPNAPTPEEHEKKGVLKSRYMAFRESLSSTTNLGFRVDGIKKWEEPKKTFQLAKTFDQVCEIFAEFTQTDHKLIKQYLEQIESLKLVLENSDFFYCHEIVGSSLLFIHDTEPETATIKMIDFARVQHSRNGKILHSVFSDGEDQEDGYLIGMENITNVFKSLLR